MSAPGEHCPFLNRSDDRCSDHFNIGRLGQAAQDGLADPRDRLRPAVEPLLALRTALRGEGNFAAADAIREALAAAGLDVDDTPEGTRWQPTEAGAALGD